MARGWPWLVLFVAACTERNPLYCDRNEDCASGFCHVATNTCMSAGVGVDASPTSRLDATVDASPADANTNTLDAAPDASAHVCSSTCPTCIQQNRACCGLSCCGIG